VLRGRKDLNGTGNDGGNEITGNGGDNILTGLLGSDTLAGGKGNDNLFGGGQADTFVYATGFDRDVIEDADGTDWIDLSGIDEAVSLDALVGLADGTTGNVVLDFGSGDKLIVRDMTLGEFAELQFVFSGVPG
jgi:Ca2+-binding RTX toxin-like protein